MADDKPGTNGNGKAHPQDAPAAKPAAQSRRIKCPQCGKLAAWEGNPSRPFCSERCRLIDLGSWADGSYAVPAEKVPDKEEE